MILYRSKLCSQLGGILVNRQAKESIVIRDLDRTKNYSLLGINFHVSLFKFKTSFPTQLLLE